MATTVMQPVSIVSLVIVVATLQMVIAWMDAKQAGRVQRVKRALGIRQSDDKRKVIFNIISRVSQLEENTLEDTTIDAAKRLTGVLAKINLSVCNKGTYGNACNDTCGMCVSGSDNCSTTDGQCMHGCEAGWLGATCKQGCNKGAYGYGCNESCGMCFGGKDSCSAIDGQCMLGCEVGWRGDNCKQGMTYFIRKFRNGLYQSISCQWERKSTQNSTQALSLCSCF
ncbi:hypothetical protein CHS0354_040084 [Potamilus streckersoni]|uniref:Uncharacterized protein n=1 Tax=Potamilus streckersoni TaxID=2493646 RepID=A0AAE0STK9_9BIVA|nr:hypothetical protein CHS0354_040084 [Potamilus streckersoni]